MNDYTLAIYSEPQLKTVAILYRVHCPVTGNPIQAVNQIDFSEDYELAKRSQVVHTLRAALRENYTVARKDYTMYARAYTILEHPQQYINFSREKWTDLPSRIHDKHCYKPD